MANTDISDDEDEGDLTHVTTSGDDMTCIEALNEWTQWRDALASLMFTEWQLCNTSYHFICSTTTFLK